MRVMILEDIADSSALPVAQRKWIWDFETVTSKYLNVDNVSVLI